MVTIMQTMIHQNNATVAFLRERNVASAVVSSTSAMNLIQQYHRTKPSARDIPTFTSSDCLDRCMLLWDAVSSGQQMNGEDDDDDAPFVYDLGIMIPLLEDEGADSATMEYFIASIAIFNSALAHQLLAQEHEQDKDLSQRYLFKAKQLYELALRGCSDVLQDNVLFQFVVLNNIAVIELQTGNAALSSQYFEVLTSMLMVLVDRGCTTRLNHLRGFARNLSLFQVNKTASAA